MKNNDMIGSVPSSVLGMLGDLMVKLQKGVITYRELELFTKRQNPFAITNIREEWQEFYRKYFRLTVDFSDVNFPEDPGGFERIVFIPQGLTFKAVIKAMRKHFKVSLYKEDLDSEVIENVRTLKMSYAVRFRNRIEADEELKNNSANHLQKNNINTITLMERLILELKYYDETTEHLDVNNVTLCAGSRYSGGCVPDVGWSDGRLRVGWYYLGAADGFLRSREAVS